MTNKTNKTNTRPAITVLEDGVTALVPLGNLPGQFAKVDLPDLQRLQAEGYGKAWFVNSNGDRLLYVRTTGLPGEPTLRQVARLIMDARPKEIVRHEDGNRLNLTRRNLRVVPRAKHLAARRLTAGVEAQATL